MQDENIRKRALGRGLSALIPEREVALEPAKVTSPEKGGVLYLDIDRIKPNKHQPREEFDQEGLEGLASSLKEKGFIQPIVVRSSPGGYEVIAGERRLRASKLLKINKIPAIIREASDDESLELALIENVQRKGLNPIEEARAYQYLLNNFNLTQDQISQRVGKARASIANTIRLLKLPADIQGEIRKGAISFAHGRLLLEIDNPQKQKAVAKKIIQKGLSIRELENLIAGSSKSKTSKIRAGQKKEPEVVAEEEKLRRILGTKVNINMNRKRGKIEIEFYSLDDLERILAILKSR